MTLNLAESGMLQPDPEWVSGLLRVCYSMPQDFRLNLGNVHGQGGAD